MSLYPVAYRLHLQLCHHHLLLSFFYHVNWHLSSDFGLSLLQMTKDSTRFFFSLTYVGFKPVRQAAVLWLLSNGRRIL